MTSKCAFTPREGQPAIEGKERRHFPRVRARSGGRVVSSSAVGLFGATVLALFSMVKTGSFRWSRVLVGQGSLLLSKQHLTHRCAEEHGFVRVCSFLLG